MDEQKPKVQVIPANPFKRYKKEDDVNNGGVGIYCRVSTTEQKQLNSLSNQVSGLLKYLKEEGIAVHPRREQTRIGNMSGEKYVPDSSLQSVFLRCDNRLNRKRYILRCLTVSVVVSAGMVGLALIADRLSGSAITAAAVVLWLIAFIPGLLLTIRRLHDLDKPSWWCIGMFIPIVNFLLLFFLLFYRGTKGPNRYGPDPLDIGQ